MMDRTKIPAVELKDAVKVFGNLSELEVIGAGLEEAVLAITHSGDNGYAASKLQEHLA